MSEEPATNNLASRADNATVPSVGGTRLRPPRSAALLFSLSKAGGARYRYRLLQGIALSLALNQTLLLWVGEMAGARATGQTRLLGSTVYWDFGIAVVAGWVLLGGWFDEPTRALFEQLATHRGYSVSVCRRLEAVAAWRWLALVLAFPIIAFTLVAAVRVSALSDLLLLALNAMLGLVFAQLIAAGVAFAVIAMRKLERRNARQLWVVTCLLPELLAPVFPGFPTLRGLATAAEQFVLRWGATG